MKASRGRAEERARALDDVVQTQKNIYRLVLPANI